MKKTLSHLLLAVLAISSAVPLGASLQSALDHGVPAQQYRNTRALWALLRDVYTCRGSGPCVTPEQQGFVPSEYALSSDAEVIVTMVYDGARARNTLGWYDASDPGNRRVIWRDASTGPNAPLEQGSQASLGILPVGTQLRFYLQVDGARGGSLILHQDATLNPDGINQVAGRLFNGLADAPMVLGFEDRPFAGDEDYNDMIILVEIRPVAGPNLYRVNSATGTTSHIAQLGLTGDFRSAAVDNVTGQILIMENAGNRIAQVSPFSGNITGVAPLGLDGQLFDSIAYVEQSDMFIAVDNGSGSIMAVNLDSGESYPIGTLPEGLTVTDLVFNESAQALLVAGFDELGPALWSYDPYAEITAFGNRIDMASTVTGLSWNGTGTLVAMDIDGTLGHLDSSSGEFAPIRDGAPLGDLTSSGQHPAAEADTPPMQLYASGADVITQHNDVIPGQAGVNSNRGGRGLRTVLTNAGMQGAEYELFHELFYIPSNATTLTFRLLDDRGSFKFDFSFFDYACVEGLVPGTLEWSVAAVTNAHSIFDDRLYNPGAEVTLDVAELGLNGKVVGFFIIPNNRIQTYLRNPWRYTPKGSGNNTKRQPLFSLSAANPGQLDQCMAFSNGGSTIFSFEDLTRYNAPGERGWNSDNSFDDMTFSVTPALDAVGMPVETFLLEPAPEDIRLTQTTADTLIDYEALLESVDEAELIDLSEQGLLRDAYIKVTALRVDQSTESSLAFTDPARPHEHFILWESLASLQTVPGSRPTVGLGWLPTENLIGFHISTVAEQDTRSLFAGRLPGTDYIVLGFGNVPGDFINADSLFLVSFEAWSLHYSGDVRNLLIDHDGHMPREGHCY